MQVNENPPAWLKIERKDNFDFGAFVLTKFVFALDATGKHYFVSAFCVLQGILMSITFVLDVAGIVIVFVAKGLYLLLKLLFQVLIKALETIFKSVFGFALKVTFVITLILILLTKWHEITEIIKIFQF